MHACVKKCKVKTKKNKYGGERTKHFSFRSVYYYEIQHLSNQSATFLINYSIEVYVCITYYCNYNFETIDH